jgi:hypothetical protein
LFAAVGGAVGTFTQMDVDGVFAKAMQLAARIMFVPFIRTPINFMRKGIRHVPNPVSLLDIGILFGRNQITKDADTGKWRFKWNSGGHNPEIIERMAMQLQGGVLAALLWGLAPGDDDDDKKGIIIPGSPSQKRAEREAMERSGLGPMRISFRRKDGTERFGFNYGRLEPFGITTGTVIDVIRKLKVSARGGMGDENLAYSVLGGLYEQAKDKSYLRGISDALNMAEDMAKPDESGGRAAALNRFTASKASMAVPNLIRQVVRESDPHFRDRGRNLTEEFFYQMWPSGIKPAKTDPYGKPLKKDRKSVV